MSFNTTQNYYEWEKRPPYTAPDGRTAYLVYTVGANTVKNSGGTIQAYSTDIAIEDVESGSQRSRIASLSWLFQTVQGFTVHAQDWMDQGLEIHMWKMARTVEPTLHFSEPLSSDEQRLVEIFKAKGLM